MKYISTRGEAPAQSFCDILLGGLAPDGGLYLPGIYPQVSAAELAEWRGLPYHALALKILQKFVDDIPACDLKMLADRTYSANVYRHCRPGRPGLPWRLACGTWRISVSGPMAEA